MGPLKPRETGKPLIPHVACRATLGRMNTRAPIDFYFDFSSPYSYIASEWIEALAARHGRTVRWHAILLGATFQAAGLQSPVSHPLKREYSLLDFERSARFEGVPLKMPVKFPIPTQNAARLFWYLDSVDPVTRGWAGDAFVTWRAGAVSCIRLDTRMDTAAQAASVRNALTTWAATRASTSVVDLGSETTRLTACS